MESPLFCINRIRQEDSYYPYNIHVETDRIFAEPIIRCKDCAYYGVNKELNVEMKGSCLFWFECALGVSPDDFCSHAVRKT